MLSNRFVRSFASPRPTDGIDSKAWQRGAHVGQLKYVHAGNADARAARVSWKKYRSLAPLHLFELDG